MDDQTHFVAEIPYICPICKSDQVAIIQYGYPRRFGDGSWGSTGGCVRHARSPLWICRNCNAKFIPLASLRKSLPY